MKIGCRAGYRVNDDNECEKVQDKKPVATRDDATKRDTERKKGEAAPVKPQSSGQMVCNNAGCRPVRPGCRLKATHPRFSRRVTWAATQTLRFATSQSLRFGTSPMPRRSR